MPQEELTKLSLYEWARIMGIQPLHFMGVQIAGIDQGCQGAWFRWQWQDAGRVSREDVATAIARAESDIETALGYRLVPSWEVDEWRPIPQPYDRRLVNLNGRDVRGFRLGAEARWKHFISGGIRSKEVIANGAAVAYSTTRPPATYDGQAEVVVPTVALDPQEVRVYYPDHGGDDYWEIRPVSVTIAGGNATIRFPRELAVAEDRESGIVMAAELRPADGTNDAHFLTEVDVWRVYNDPQQQVSLLWAPFGAGCGCGDSGCGECSYAVQAGCISLTGDPKLSLLRFTPATWNATTQQFDGASLAQGRGPDLARLYYYAGLRDRSLSTPNIRMDPRWARIVAYYAASLLERDPCACFRGQWSQWRLDLADPEMSIRLSDTDLASPFGLRRGALNAWHAVLARGAAISQAAVWG